MRPFTGRLVALFILAVASEAAAQQQTPRLVVVITVDQLAAGYVERYRPQFTGGLKRILDEGAWFTSARHEHGQTSTAPGHASILSGRYPYSTGIARNDEGVPDTTVRLLGTTGTGASPHRFRGTALLDWVRTRWPDARMLSVSRKDRGAILPVGRSREGVWVYWHTGGHFTTSTWYADSLPAWVAAFDAGAAPLAEPGRWWTLQREAAAYPEPDSVPWENRGRQVTFPYAMRSAAQLHDMPWMDSLLLAFALAGQRELRLGATGAPDILAVSLSTLDAIGHEFGPDSREVHDHMLWIDRYLGAFLDSLDARLGRGRVLVAFTADHGLTPRPENSWQRSRRAAFVPVDSVIRPLRDTLAQRYGAARFIPWRDVGQVAVDRRALRAAGADPDSIIDLLAARLRALPGVLQVDTRRTLARADTTRDWPARWWRRALGPESLGEVFLTPEPLFYVGRPVNFQHGHTNDTDARVPLVIAGPGVRRGVYSRPVAVVDLGPTLAALLGVRPTERTDGRVLAEAVR